MTDHLSRQPYLDLLKSIITNQCDNSKGYSFAIDGEWGCGKTWIINELENQLTEEKENKYLIFHYNAWENDFYDEPLVALLSVMIESLKEHKKSIKEKGTASKIITSSITSLMKVAGTVVEKKYNINPNEIIDSVKESGKAVADIKLTKSDFNKMLPLENALKQIKEVITKLSQEKHILLIVDELDRCLPEYAIKVLERLHHICNEMPVIQILAINKKNLADSIAKVFGKDYPKEDYPEILINLFCESYLQKFVDMIIPLPNGKIDSRLEVLNGLEKDFTPYVRPKNFRQEVIKVDEEFLAAFVSSLMNGIEKRLQEKIYKQVALCHKLTIQTGIQYDKERMTYAILIYEIISCICKYVYHSKEICKFIIHNDFYTLDFYNGINMPVIPETTEFEIFQNNIQSFLNFPVKYYEDMDGRNRYAFEIFDTKSYLLAFFTKQEIRSQDPLQNGLWQWIGEDKIFLKKYDEIMDMLRSNI